MGVFSERMQQLTIFEMSIRPAYSNTVTTVLLYFVALDEKIVFSSFLNTAFQESADNSVFMSVT